MYEVTMIVVVVAGSSADPAGDTEVAPGPDVVPGVMTVKAALSVDVALMGTVVGLPVWSDTLLTA